MKQAIFQYEEQPLNKVIQQRETVEENTPWQLASCAPVRGSFILNKSTSVTPSALYRTLSDSHPALSRKREQGGKWEPGWIRKGEGP